MNSSSWWPRFTRLFLVDFYACCSCLLKRARTGSTFFRHWGLQVKRRWVKDLGLSVSWDCFCLRRRLQEGCFASDSFDISIPQIFMAVVFTCVTDFRGLSFRSGHLLITQTSREGNLINIRREKMISILSTTYPLIIPTSSFARRKVCYLSRNTSQPSLSVLGSRIPL